jgi:TPR repeat protein
MHEKGTGVVRDDDLALELYGRGCAAGSVPACSAEGVLVVETSLTASARAAGIAKVKLACEQHYQKACNELPKLERCERGGIADCEARCDEGEAAICAMLGDYHAEGRWVAASEVEARRFYRLAYDTSLGRCR